MTNDSANRAPEIISRGRVEALSDGVFAIVVTLLVLEIPVPHVAEHESMAELARALWTLAPKFVSWVISFATVCVIWLNHHRLFAIVRRIDNGLFWLNANLLLWTSFIPFPTAVMGDYPRTSHVRPSRHSVASRKPGVRLALFKGEQTPDCAAATLLIDTNAYGGTTQ